MLLLPNFDIGEKIGKAVIKQVKFLPYVGS